MEVEKINSYGIKELIIDIIDCRYRTGLWG